MMLRRIRGKSIVISRQRRVRCGNRRSYLFESKTRIVIESFSAGELYEFNTIYAQEIPEG